MEGLSEGARKHVIIRTVSYVLEELVNNTGRKDSAMFYPYSKFDAEPIPSVSIMDYLQHIVLYVPCSLSCYVIALVYLDTILQNNPSFCVTQRNVHLLLLTSVMTAMKANDDFFYTNAYYAKVGGITGKEMNLLELDFLSHLNFSLFVTKETYDVYMNSQVLKFFAGQVRSWVIPPVLGGDLGRVPATPSPPVSPMSMRSSDGMDTPPSVIPEKPHRKRAPSPMTLDPFSNKRAPDLPVNMSVY